MNMPQTKTVYLLVGAKGSGKSHIGRLVEKLLTIEFIEVEQRLIEYLEANPSQSNQLANDGFDLELKWINEALLLRDEVISEATGSSQYLPRFLDQLSQRYKLKIIRIFCPLETCFSRVKSRSKVNQFEVPEEKIHAINLASHIIDLDWSLEIDNSGPAPEQKIVSLFSTLRTGK